jgi:hypothetical protein
MSYAECLKKYYNAVDGTFYDAITIEVVLLAITYPKAVHNSILFVLIPL